MACYLDDMVPLLSHSTVVRRSFKLSEEDQKKYKVVKEKFDSDFVRKHNVIYERAKFNMEEGEPAEAFVTDLYGALCLQ